MAGAVTIDGCAIHELHDQVRRPVGSCSGVQHPGDVGMLHARQDLPFLTEAADDLVVEKDARDHFDGYLPPYIVVIALGQVDGAHAAGPNARKNGIGSQSRER